MRPISYSNEQPDSSGIVELSRFIHGKSQHFAFSLGREPQKAGPAPLERVADFERGLREALPDDYRAFLISSNGGHVGGRLWFRGPTPEGRSADAGELQACKR